MVEQTSQSPGPKSGVVTLEEPIRLPNGVVIKEYKVRASGKRKKVSGTGTMSRGITRDVYNDS